MPAPERGTVYELLERADAVAARYDAAIAAHHAFHEGEVCAACREWDARLIEIERQERNRERTR